MDLRSEPFGHHQGSYVHSALLAGKKNGGLHKTTPNVLAIHTCEPDTPKSPMSARIDDAPFVCEVSQNRDYQRSREP